MATPRMPEQNRQQHCTVLRNNRYRRRAAAIWHRLYEDLLNPHGSKLLLARGQSRDARRRCQPDAAYYAGQHRGANRNRM
eukprot:11158068-Lingulodinium_polyedra.AAC.1